MSQRPRRRITSAKREQIELDLKLLSKQIVRPFEVVSDLPVSYNEPPAGHYEDVLKNPLTVKDSGSLYMSLIKSRQNYVYTCPMFPLFWQKQSSYARKMQNSEKHQSQGQNDTGEKPSIISSDVNAREAMVKLCDASLSLGPHEFDIRVFIAKDERSETPKKEESNSNEESKGIESSSGELSSNKDMKDDEKTKMPVYARNCTEEKDSGTKTQGNPNENDETSSTRERPDPKGRGNNTSVKDTEKDATGKDGLRSETDANANDNDETRTASKQETRLEENINTKDIENIDENGREKKERSPDPVAKNEDNEKEKSHIPEDTTQGEAYQNQYSLQSEKSREESLGTEAEEPQTSLAPVQELQREPTGHLVTPSPNPKRQSIENAIMISNLNTVARFDPSLNMLMKVVALGNASPQQILAFQGYIHRAREMGPGPQHAYLFPNGQIPNSYTVAQKRPVKEKRKTKSKVVKEQKLTTFQEKYFNNATLLFEFVENPNVRYMLPKEAIGEVLPTEGENSDTEVNNVLVSFLWIHNQKELSRYQDLVKEFEEYQKEKEKEKNEEDARKEKQGETIPENESGDGNGATENNKMNNKEEINHQKNTNKGFKTRNTRKSTQNTSKKRKIERKVLPVEPEIRYTEVSLTIRSIPSKFVPIIMNSFKPLEEVQHYMTEILKKGARTASYYIWYQIDGKLDEELAERLRCQLNQEERKMPGVGISSSLSTGAYQRKRREKIKESQPKKAKMEKKGNKH